VASQKTADNAEMDAAIETIKRQDEEAAASAAAAVEAALQRQKDADQEALNLAVSDQKVQDQKAAAEARRLQRKTDVEEAQAALDAAAEEHKKHLQDSIAEQRKQDEAIMGKPDEEVAQVLVAFALFHLVVKGRLGAIDFKDCVCGCMCAKSDAATADYTRRIFSNSPNNVSRPVQRSRRRLTRLPRRRHWRQARFR
jgi:hypothetical protein